MSSTSAKRTIKCLPADATNSNATDFDMSYNDFDRRPADAYFAVEAKDYEGAHYLNSTVGFGKMKIKIHVIPESSMNIDLDEREKELAQYKEDKLRKQLFVDQLDEDKKVRLVREIVKTIFPETIEREKTLESGINLIKTFDGEQPDVSMIKEVNGKFEARYSLCLAPGPEYDCLSDALGDLAEDALILLIGYLNKASNNLFKGKIKSISFNVAQQTVRRHPRVCDRITQMKEVLLEIE